MAELLADPEWRGRYHEAVVLVAAAWGWDVERAAPRSTLYRGEGT